MYLNVDYEGIAAFLEIVRYWVSLVQNNTPKSILSGGGTMAKKQSSFLISELPLNLNCSLYRNQPEKNY